jgi:hypothetical protein
MATLSNNTSNDKSMNGLVTIDANAIFTDELDVDTLVVNLDATAPTVGALSNDTHIATTAWVTTHGSGNYVTLGTTQSITGEKTFSNTNTIVSGTLKNDSHQGSTTVSTQNIATTQTSGILNIATLSNRSSAVNINTGATSTAPVNISSATTGNAPITIGSASSTTQTATHNAISTFTASNTYTTGTLNCSNLSGLALNVTDDSTLSNVTIDGVSFFNDISTFNLGATFSSVLPTSTVVPVSGPDLTNKTYVDSVVPASILPLNNTFTGTNTFNNTLDVVITAVNKLSISSSSITLNPTTTITNQIGGVSKMTINSTTTTINNSSFLQNQIGGVNKLYISNTNITTNPTTTSDFQINGNTIISLSAGDVTFNPSTSVSTKIGGVFKIQTTSTAITNYVPTINSGLTYPLTTDTQIGYTNSTTTSTRMSVANTTTDIASIAITQKGCYIVEGNYLFTGTATSLNHVFLGLSTTSVTFDSSRECVATSANLATLTGAHITSVFNVNDLVTTIYLIGRVTSNLGASTLQTNYLSITKIA